MECDKRGNINMENRRDNGGKIEEKKIQVRIKRSIRIKAE
jgi:hypothetical protein